MTAGADWRAPGPKWKFCSTKRIVVSTENDLAEARTIMLVDDGGCQTPWSASSN